MGTVNRIFIVGRLGANPELRYTAQGTAVCKFNVATDRFGRRDDSATSATDWHRVVAWNRLGQQCHKSLVKGRQVAVVGAVRYDTFVGQDGQKRWTTEIRAEEVSFLGQTSEFSGRPKPSAAELSVETSGPLIQEDVHDLAS